MQTQRPTAIRSGAIAALLVALPTLSCGGGKSGNPAPSLDSTLPLTQVGSVYDVSLGVGSAQYSTPNPLCKGEKLLPLQVSATLAQQKVYLNGGSSETVWTSYCANNTGADCSYAGDYYYPKTYHLVRLLDCSPALFEFTVEMYKANVGVGTATGFKPTGEIVGSVDDRCVLTLTRAPLNEIQYWEKHHEAYAEAVRVTARSKFGIPTDGQSPANTSKTYQMRCWPENRSIDFSPVTN